MRRSTRGRAGTGASAPTSPGRSPAAKPGEPGAHPCEPRSRPPQDGELRRTLTDKGIRVTEQRMVILRALAKLRTPISHPELTGLHANDPEA